ncbi:hypothetical protein BDV37DRAFT_277413 [Aspergillus pseudonomiae]|uniref:C2H2-type domain-containing protein n=1 Tax=Aspergillus pseudonomiae TaxID=1506151 RepID=A0A5N7DW69_9EURO|nr:uncharacterized protein BDV37DRAFT_277413 [Aspergillus pseudonomiae]KAE8409758.1 hypothetical protein BDV37DRAFT_277413 [Aspergillus pseudonomiae]
MDHTLPHRPQSPTSSNVGTLGSLDPSYLADSFPLSGLPGNNNRFETFDASIIALPENVHTEPDSYLISANAESFFTDGTTVNYTPPCAFEPTASYLTKGTSISQPVPPNGETSSLTGAYAHGDSYPATFSNIPSPSTTTGNGRDPLQTSQAPCNAAFLEGQQSLPRRRSRYMINKHEKQAVPVFIPTSIRSPDPLRRWQESPPEDEPAPLSAIRDAVQHSWSERLVNEGFTADEHQQGISDSRLVDAFQTYRQSGSRAASTTSAESGVKHNHGACDGQQRKFRRKDHLVQHLRLVHRIDSLPIISDWKVEATNFTSRCGFCDRQMITWSQRCDHLAWHFRNGSTMADWQGDHGFPDSIATQVTHAVPPYLIDLESRTMVPFSATNDQVKDHFSQMLSRAAFQSDTNAGGDYQERLELPDLLGQLQVQDTGLNSYTQVLTRHLSHYAEEQTRLGIVPTDEMFQQEARRLLFDSEDPWNQTIADHPQWLAAFRETQSSSMT